MELGLLEADAAEEPVHVVDGQVEDLGLALLLLAHLQHPVGDDLPHVGLDLGLDGLEVVLALGVHAAVVVVLPGQDVGEDAGIVDEDRVLVGPHVGDPNVFDTLKIFHCEKIIHFGGEEKVDEDQLWKSS